jgi:curved DNA-binding protein CbpA
MSSAPDIDPYAALGVAKDATLAEIRAAHRKRVLKCHPDKIQDESQRNAAQDEFQRVQQAYELLSDESRRTKYDAKVNRLAELKAELERRRTESYGSPRGSGSSNREYRNGRIVEERVPLEVYLDETLRFTEEPRPMSRKYEEYGMRSKTKPTEEKKKKTPATPMSAYYAAKEQRESTKATHSDRAKTRDQERRRQASAKYDTFESYAESDDASDSSAPRYVFTKRTATPRRERESRSRPEASRHERYDDDDFSDHWQSKINNKTTNAEDYIASKGRSSRSPRRYRGYDSTEPDSSSSRPSGRSTRPTTRRPSTSRNNSYDYVESPREKPKMQPATTSPSIKSSLRPSFLNHRAATSSGFSRPKRESTLYQMAHEPMPSSRSSKPRDRYDSGYSSPTTPEMPMRGSSPNKTHTRYKIVEEPDRVVVEPKSASSKYRSSSPDRAERTSSSARQPPKRSSTFQTYPSEPASSPRIEVRSSRPSRPASYRDTDYSPRPKDKDVKYSRAYGPEDISYSRRHHYDEDPRPPAVGRRQSAYAY